MKVSGSILTDKMKVKEAVKAFENGKADYIHVDVMDGKFVKNKSFSISEVSKLDTNLKLDIHLMVKNPEKYIDPFSTLNTEYITFHYEAVKAPMLLITHIKNNGLRVGVSIKPSTKVSDIFFLLPYVDMVLVMSVEPGESGQEFMSDTFSRVEDLKKEIEEKCYNTIIEVDGGVNEENVRALKTSGADMVVSSSYLLSGDTSKKIEYIKSI